MSLFIFRVFSSKLWFWFFALTVPVIASAAFTPTTTLPNPSQCANDFYCTFVNISNWFFGIVLLIAVFTFLYGAFRFFVSAGNETAVTQAKLLIRWAIVGVIVAMLAKSIILVVGNLIGVQTPDFFGGCIKDKEGHFCG